MNEFCQSSASQSDSIADWRGSSQGLAAGRDFDSVHVGLGSILLQKSGLRGVSAAREFLGSMRDRRLPAARAERLL
jgi:hypothetical protein